MRTRVLHLAAVLLLAATAVFPQAVPDPIGYQPVSCITPDQLPVFQLNLAIPGELRAYFRFVNTPDWCWVQGNNLGPVSTVVMPKFRAGQEIEYFFVVLEKKRVIAKSPVLYRAKATEHCDTLVARHSLDFIVDCSHEVSGGGAAFLAGNAFTPTDTGHPPYVSPDRPDQQQ